MHRLAEDTLGSETPKLQECRSAAADRNKLVDTAIAHFYKKGCRQSPITEIIEEANLPISVYDSNFNSMEELVIAALEKWDDNCRAWLTREMQARGSSSKDQILGLFAALFEWFQTADYRGCLFISAAVEYKSQNDPVHQTAAAHKRRFAKHVEGLLEKSGAEKPKTVAEKLMLVMEGAIVTTHTIGNSDAGRVAYEMADQILRDALPANAA